MQEKNIILLKLTALIIALLIAYPISTIAYEKSAQGNEKKDQSNSKGVIIFDSCGKDVADKCGKETKIPVPDYSKSLK